MVTETPKPKPARKKKRNVITTVAAGVIAVLTVVHEALPLVKDIISFFRSKPRV